MAKKIADKISEAPKITYTTDWPIIGHEWAVEHLTRSLSNDRVRHAYLITGPAGVGKTTFWRAFAQAVNFVDEKNRSCGVCRACKLISPASDADVRITQAEGNTTQ